MENNRPLIFVTNDDGINAKGLQALIDIVKPFGKVVVVAPEEGQSGMSHALTVKTPIRLRKIEQKEGFEKYAVSGTPVDCVKLAFNQLLSRRPDLVVSGVNNGSNSSVSVVYSGTMGAAIEGCLYGVPSVGFSSLDMNSNQDFELAKRFCGTIVEKVLSEGISQGTCLNVNLPAIKADECKGVKICRQNKGRWIEEFEKRTDPHGGEYYWLTGSFENHEPESTDTDEWALNHKYISIVPIKVDFTDYASIETLNERFNTIRSEKI